MSLKADNQDYTALDNVCSRLSAFAKDAIKEMLGDIASGPAAEAIQQDELMDASISVVVSKMQRALRLALESDLVPEIQRCVPDAFTSPPSSEPSSQQLPSPVGCGPAGLASPLAGGSGGGADIEASAAQAAAMRARSQRGPVRKNTPDLSGLTSAANMQQQQQQYSQAMSQASASSLKLGQSSKPGSSSQPLPLAPVSGDHLESAAAQQQTLHLLEQNILRLQHQHQHQHQMGAAAQFQSQHSYASELSSASAPLQELPPDSRSGSLLYLDIDASTVPVSAAAAHEQHKMYGSTDMDSSASLMEGMSSAASTARLTASLGHSSISNLLSGNSAPTIVDTQQSMVYHQQQQQQHHRRQQLQQLQHMQMQQAGSGSQGMSLSDLLYTMNINNSAAGHQQGVPLESLRSSQYLMAQDAAAAQGLPPGAFIQLPGGAPQPSATMLAGGGMLMGEVMSPADALGPGGSAYMMSGLRQGPQLMPGGGGMHMVVSDISVDGMTMLPARFSVLSPVVQRHVVQLTQTNPVITIHDFDEKVVNKMALLADKYGQQECFTMLDNLAGRMRSKQGCMKNGPGYLDVAVSSHLDMLKAQGMCPNITSIQEYAKHTLSNAAYDELDNAIKSSHWLQWEHLDQGIIHLIKKLPADSVGQKLMEIAGRSFRNVDNVKGCIMSILNSKIRERNKSQILLKQQLQLQQHHQLQLQHQLQHQHLLQQAQLM